MLFALKVPPKLIQSVALAIPLISDAVKLKLIFVTVLMELSAGAFNVTVGDIESLPYVESVRQLWLQEPPEPSPLGILLAVLSLIVMPVLARKKYRTGKALGSAAMVGDSKQTLACSLLSVALLLGLSLNAAFDWWWADPIAGLAMVPWLLKEGQEALRGEVCCE